MGVLEIKKERVRANHNPNPTPHTPQTPNPKPCPKGLSMIVMDPGIIASAGDPSKQRVIMRFPTGGGAADPSALPSTTGGMYALTYPATPFSSTSRIVEPSAPVQLFLHSGGWKVAARQYGRWLRYGNGLICFLCFVPVLSRSRTATKSMLMCANPWLVITKVNCRHSA